MGKAPKNALTTTTSLTERRSDADQGSPDLGLRKTLDPIDEARVRYPVQDRTRKTPDRRLVTDPFTETTRLFCLRQEGSERRSSDQTEAGLVPQSRRC